MASQIKALRKSRGISAGELADALGNSVKAVHAWEHGQGQPDADKLVAICQALSANISDFYDPALVGNESNAVVDAKERELLSLFVKMDSKSRDALIFVARSLARTSWDTETEWPQP